MTEEELIKDVINYIEDDVNAYDHMIYEDKQEWEDYLKRVFREVRKPLEKKNEELREKINNLEKFKYNIPNDKTETVPTITKSYKNEYEDYKSRIDKAIESNKEITRAVLTYSSYEKYKIEDMLYEQEQILKGGE